jgi:hypothetical protein
VKPETGGGAEELPPGSTWDGGQDGVAVPNRPGEVYKNNNDVDIVVTPDGDIEWDGPWNRPGPWVQWLVPNYFDFAGGWKDRGYNDRHKDWGDIFRDSQKLPKCRRPDAVFFSGGSGGGNSQIATNSCG